MTEEEPIYDKCYACKYPRNDKGGKIPKVKYHDKNEEEPKQPYIAGYQKCDDDCHLK